LDLNLIKVFVAIYETRNLTLASSRLFVTQSAVSQSLAKLRKHFDDQLFVRTQGDMAPTALATQLYDTFRSSLSSIERVIDNGQNFDPAHTDQMFRIALSELGEIGWLPAIYNAVHQAAPKAKISVISLERDKLSEWLTRGTVDLAITPVSLDGFSERKYIKGQGYLVVMSSTHPLNATNLTIEAFDKTPRIVVQGDSGLGLIENAQQRAGITSPPQVTVQHFTTLPQLISDSDELIAVIPESIAQGWTHKWPLTVKELPFEMQPVELNLYRRQTSDQQASLLWLYNTVARAIGGSSGEFAAIQ
jgi:DNA-binding transcriptional LysR family regulator